MKRGRMATLMNGNAEDSGRAGNSPRPKGRGKENAKDTLCRNVTIYGHCRYEDKGCAFNHDPIKPQMPPNHTENIKKRFNVDSPSFTPSSLAVNGSNITAKTPGLSPKAANAAPFRPRNLTPAPSAASSSVSLSSKSYNPNAPDWISPEAQEFLPQAYTTSTLHERTTISSDARETGTNNLKIHLGYIVPHHDSTTLTDGPRRIPTAHDGEQDKASNIESPVELSTSTNDAGLIKQPQSSSQEETKTSFDVPESGTNEVEDSRRNRAQQQDPTNPANGNPRTSNAYSVEQDSSDILGDSTAYHEDSVMNTVQEQDSTTSTNVVPRIPAVHSMDQDRCLSHSKASGSGLMESVSDPQRVIENEHSASTPNIATSPQFQGMIPEQLDGQTDLKSRHERLRPCVTPTRRRSNPTATEHESFNSDVGGDRASATTSGDRGFCRLGVTKMTPPLEPTLTPSATSTKNPAQHQILRIVPAIPRIFMRRLRARSSVVGGGLKTNGGPLRERQDQRSAEESQAVEKASYAATEATMVNQESSGVDPRNSQPLSCSSSPSAPITNLGHEKTSRGAVKDSQASSSGGDLFTPAEAIGHRKSSSVDAEVFRSRESNPLRTPTKHFGHRKSFSPLAPDFHPFRNSSVPSTPSNLGQPVHSRQPSRGSGEPTHVDYAASDTVRGARDQQHGHPTSTYHSPQAPQPYPGAPTPAISLEALTLRDPAVVSYRRLSPALDMHTPHSHLALWQTTSGMANAYLLEQNDNNSDYTQPNPFESYATSTPAAPTPNPSDVQTNAGLYATDTNGFQSAYFTNTNSSNQILNHHLYAPLEPQTNSNQKYGRDLFIPEDLRRRLLDKTEATLRTFSDVSRLPYVDPYHSLTPLEWNNRGNPTSTVYKAVHAQDGRTYCLRRFHNLEATDMNKLAVWDIRKTWSTIRNSSVVSLHLAFSTGKFGDHSIVIVSDYHPASKTFAEKYFSRSNRTPDPPIKGEILWKYLIQIANALKEIHSKARAARFIDTNKVLVTDENRIRLNGCAIKDILEPQSGDIEELKRLDLYEFGKFMFAISSKPKTRAPPALDSHEITLRPIVQWLLDHHRPDNNQDIDQLLSQISTNIIKEFDATLAVDDKLQSYLNRELENSRIVRLMTKLHFLNERPEYEKDNQWSSQGSRAILPLFRDYVFHSEDAQGNPVVDMGHVITCLNKLDVGVEEKLTLTTRDEHNVIVVSYKELRAMLDRAWADLMAKSSG